MPLAKSGWNLKDLLRFVESYMHGREGGKEAANAAVGTPRKILLLTTQRVGRLRRSRNAGCVVCWQEEQTTQSNSIFDPLIRPDRICIGVCIRPL